MPDKEERPRETDRPGKNPDPVTEDDQFDEARQGKRRPNQAPDEDITREKDSNREPKSPRQGEEQGGGSRRDR
jgi:hypothetical protein